MSSNRLLLYAIGPFDRAFDTEGRASGNPEFIARADLLDPKNGLLVDDQLKIHCKVCRVVVTLT